MHGETGFVGLVAARAVAHRGVSCVCGFDLGVSAFVAMEFRECIERAYEYCGCDRNPSDDEAAMWMEVFRRHAPAVRPLTVVHLESGSGLLTPFLADTFGGPAFGVEPFARSREAAGRWEAHPAVTYMDGRISEIPLPPDSCDLVVVFPLWHQMREPERAVREIARVLRPGGRVMLKAWFADRLPILPWHAWYPRSREIEMPILPELAGVAAAFAESGLRRIAVERVRQTVAPHMADYVDGLVAFRRLVMRPELRPEEERTGWDAACAAIEAGQAGPVEEDFDLLVLG
ncbi:class I SAM-dependent methyltransferase [Yinghuangia aomiensis]